MGIDDVLTTVKTEDATIIGVLLLVAIVEAIVIIFLWRWSTKIISEKDAALTALSKNFQRETVEIVKKFEDELDEMAEKYADLASRYEVLAREALQRFDQLLQQMAKKVFGNGTGGDE